MMVFLLEQVTMFRMWKLQIAQQRPKRSRTALAAAIGFARLTHLTNLSKTNSV